MNRQQRLERSRTQLCHDLEQLGITATRQRTEFVVKRGRIVGFVLAFSWPSFPLDVNRLVRIIAAADGHGTIEEDATPEHPKLTTLSVSYSF